eukprot:gene9347-1434_t
MNELYNFDKYIQSHENEKARVVLVHEPGMEAVLGSLHSSGALFEKPVNIELARKHHTKFRETMAGHGIKVYTVREILSEGCEQNLKARVNLEDLAQVVLKYEFEDVEQKPSLLPQDQQVISGRHSFSEKNKQATSEIQKYYLSEEYKKQCLKSMGVHDLVDLILNGPTVVLQPSKINTPLRIKRISMNPLLNLSFTRDQQIVTRNGLIVNRMGSPQRLRETKIMEFCYKKMGIPILGVIKAPGLLEGGDFISLGDLCLIGTGLRTNDIAVDQAMKNDWFGSTRVAVVRDIFDLSQQRMHLDTVFNICGDNVCTMLEDIIGKESKTRRLVTEYTKNEKGIYVITKRDIEFSEYIQAEGFNIIKVTNAQQYAYGLNYLNVGNSNIISVHEETARKMLQSPHFNGNIEVIDFSGMTTMFGSVHCCSQVLFREERPQLQHTKKFEKEFSFYENSNEIAQFSNKLMMVAPSFGDPNQRKLTEDSLLEFSKIHQVLVDNGAKIYLFDQYVHEKTILGHFPSHLFSTHFTSDKKSKIIFYPKKKEQKKERIISLLNSWYKDNTTIDNDSLEGSGSIVFDRVNMIGYFAKSEKTNSTLAEKTIIDLGYKPFELQFSTDALEKQFTNSSLFIGSSIAIVCKESFTNCEDLINNLKKTHIVIEINQEQAIKFCASIFEFGQSKDQSFLVLSTTSFNAFSKEQVETLKLKSKLLTVDSECLEKLTNFGIGNLFAPLF